MGVLIVPLEPCAAHIRLHSLLVAFWMSALFMVLMTTFVLKDRFARADGLWYGCWVLDVVNM